MTVRLPAAERRRQLLDVATTTFANHGFHATAVSDVAEAAGVTKPVLYQHFESKRALYLEVLRDVGHRLRTSIEMATADAPMPKAQVARGLAAFLQFVADEEAAFTLLFGGGTRRDREFAATASAIEQSIAESIASRLEVPGLDGESRRIVAFGIIGLAEGAARQWLARGRSVDPADLAVLVANMAWAGLRGLDASVPG